MCYLLRVTLKRYFKGVTCNGRYFCPPMVKVWVVYVKDYVNIGAGYVKDNFMDSWNKNIKMCEMCHHAYVL